MSLVSKSPLFFLVFAKGTTHAFSDVGSETLSKHASRLFPPGDAAPVPYISEGLRCSADSERRQPTFLNTIQPGFC